MASCKLFGYDDAEKMLRHTSRKHEQTRDGHIDTARSYVNRMLSPLRDTDDESYLMQRIGEVYHVNRRTLRIMASWVVTVPKDFMEEHVSLVNEFFDTVYAFLTEKYGEINTVSAWVHYDEATPHMHFNFVPVVRDEKHGEKISSSECIPYGSYGRFHYELKDFLERHFGFAVNVVNGAVKEGNLTVLQLKIRTLDRELTDLTGEIEKKKDALRRFGSLSEMRVAKENGRFILDENTFTELLKSAQAYELYRDTVEDIVSEKKAAEMLFAESMKDISVSYALFRENIKTVLSENISLKEELIRKGKELHERESLLKEREEILSEASVWGGSIEEKLREENAILKEALKRAGDRMSETERSRKEEIRSVREALSYVYEKEYAAMSEALSRAQRLNGLLLLRERCGERLLSEEFSGEDGEAERKILEKVLLSAGREILSLMPEGKEKEEMLEAAVRRERN